MVMLFLSAFVVGLSGAMMPGSLLTYTIRKALSSGWRAGFIIVAGHAVLELGLIIVIFLGFDLVLQSKQAQIVIGLVGGILLGYMGIDMILGSVKNKISVRMDSEGSDSGNMVVSGIVLSATNPYFLLWWAIVGLGFIMQAYESYKLAGVAVYYFGHISVDFLWYGLISILVGTTRRFLGEKPYRIIIAVLGCALIFFGLKFAYGAAVGLVNLLAA
jgi:threonine/homoserine/homoserine lactone efflux protein